MPELYSSPPPPPPKAVPPPPLPHRHVESRPEQRQDWWSSEGLAESSAWLASFVVHAVVLFLLGLITVAASRSSGTSLNLLAVKGDEESASAGIEQTPWTAEPNPKPGDSVHDAKLDAAPAAVPVPAPESVVRVEAPAKMKADSPPAPGGPVRTADQGRASASPSGGGWEGRDPAARSGMAGRGGATKESEAAVERGLRWLAAHQREDGSWSFDLTKPPCNGYCKNSGSEPSATAATGLALLPFLGAGYTHLQGEHQETVKKGLYYLKSRAFYTPHGIDLRDGSTMYCQGIAAIALCEGYGMTRDEGLKDVAQGTLRFIVDAQNMQDGGWRYNPGEPGDITVTGWQLMALKSGQMAKLAVPSPNIGLVKKFLDSVQTDGGARYRYQAHRPPEPTTTSVGLLCRMYTGWRRDHKALYQGMDFLDKWGPNDNNMYYDFYATQVLHHWEGPEWQKWNRKMREHLIKTQATNSHESGSWYFPDPYGDKGGRLYNTAMAIMILEVYYRHMPLYSQEAVHDQF